ncbi:hypothetical protein BREVUG8_110286 [Brevundimonas sp. G8]|nr:hypothetical protein BREVUG8_110286 [Brevundimonas sp. G8]
MASCTRAWTSPVLGSNTSPKRPDAPSKAAPSMKWRMSRMAWISLIVLLFAYGYHPTPQVR